MSEKRQPVARPDGHGPDGRFSSGNKYGVGNPYAREVARLREVVMRALSDEQLQDLVLKLYLMAMSGDVAAMKLLFQYTMGKPVECAHPDRLDRDELECLRVNAAPDDADEVIKSTPLGPALRAARAFQPVVAEAEFARLRDEIHAAIGKTSQRPATVTKRRDERPPATIAATPPRVVAATEAISLVNPPRPEGREVDRVSPNGRHP